MRAALVWLAVVSFVTTTGCMLDSGGSELHVDDSNDSLLGEPIAEMPSEENTLTVEEFIEGKHPAVSFLGLTDNMRRRAGNRLANRFRYNGSGSRHVDAAGWYHPRGCCGNQFLYIPDDAYTEDPTQPGYANGRDDQGGGSDNGGGSSGGPGGLAPNPNQPSNDGQPATQAAYSSYQRTYSSSMPMVDARGRQIVAEALYQETYQEAGSMGDRPVVTYQVASIGLVWSLVRSVAVPAFRHIVRSCTQGGTCSRIGEFFTRGEQSWRTTVQDLRAGRLGNGQRNFSLGTANRRTAQQMGEEFVGPNAREITTSRGGRGLRSADGLRDYLEPTDKGAGRGVEANFIERATPNNGRQNFNAHLSIE